MNEIPDMASVTIFGWMINILKLKGIDLRIYSIVFGQSQDGRSRTSGFNVFLAFTGASLPTIKKSLQRLVDKNYIIRYERVEDNVKHIEYAANLKIFK